MKWFAIHFRYKRKIVTLYNKVHSLHELIMNCTYTVKMNMLYLINKIVATYYKQIRIN